VDGPGADVTDASHTLVAGAHNREEADRGAVELEDTYAREAAEEYEAAKAARAVEADGA